MRILHSRLSWVPAALWYGLIWQFSSQPGDTSADVSVGTLEGALTTGGSDFAAATGNTQLAVDWLLNTYIRKAAHIFLFFVLALLLWLALTSLLRSRPLRAGITSLLCVALASLDELHQSLVPDRSGDFSDVLIDSIGLLLALALLALPWLARQTQRLRHPERLWIPGALVSAVLLLRTGMLEGVHPFFTHRASQLWYFTRLNDANRAALLESCAPILRQSLYLLASAAAGFLCTLPAILSGSRRSMRLAPLAAVLLCLLTGLIWHLPLPGVLLTLAVSAATLLLYKAFPLLQR